VNISDWLIEKTKKLKSAGITSARLDCLILLEDVTGKDRTYHLAHPEQTLNNQLLRKLNIQIEQRVNRIPLAYIVGHKEFYGREFIVTPATLIPRPESEDMITLLKQLLDENPISHFPAPNPILLDIGTGTGCLGITAILEFPNLTVTLSDISDDVLKIAKQNAKKLSANVKIVQSDLLQNISDKPDIIIANLPYVDKTWNRSPETDFEPNLALFAKKHGLLLIKKLVSQARNSLTPGGYLIIEADLTQHGSLMKYAKKLSFITIQRLGYAVAFKIQR